jgi:hypothetical protein
MTRETVYAALFDKVKNLSGLKTSSRRLIHWGDVAPASQPALFMVQKNETGEQRRGLPTKWHLAVDFYLYSHSGGTPSSTPSQIQNPLIDAIETALAPDSTGFQTLGGLVSHAWISGPIETDQGFLGDQAVAIIPVDILTS